MFPDDFITVEDTEKVPTSTAWSFSSFTVAIGLVVVRLVSTQQLGMSGGVPPKKFMEYRDYEIASETIYGLIQCFLEVRHSFTCMNIYILWCIALVFSFLIIF